MFVYVLVIEIDHAIFDMLLDLFVGVLLRLLLLDLHGWLLLDGLILGFSV